VERFLHAGGPTQSGRLRGTPSATSRRLATLALACVLSVPAPRCACPRACGAAPPLRAPLPLAEERSRYPLRKHFAGPLAALRFAPGPSLGFSFAPAAATATRRGQSMPERSREKQTGRSHPRNAIAKRWPSLKKSQATVGDFFGTRSQQHQGRRRRRKKERGISGTKRQNAHYSGAHQVRLRASAWQPGGRFAGKNTRARKRTRSGAPGRAAKSRASLPRSALRCPASPRSPSKPKRGSARRAQAFSGTPRQARSRDAVQEPRPTTSARARAPSPLRGLAFGSCGPSAPTSAASQPFHVPPPQRGPLRRSQPPRSARASSRPQRADPTSLPHAVSSPPFQVSRIRHNHLDKHPKRA